MIRVCESVSRGGWVQGTIQGTARVRVQYSCSIKLRTPGCERVCTLAACSCHGLWLVRPSSLHSPPGSSHHPPTQPVENDHTRPKKNTPKFSPAPTMDAKLRKLKKRKRAEDYDEEDLDDDDRIGSRPKGGKRAGKDSKKAGPSSAGAQGNRQTRGMSGIRFRNKQRTLVFSSRGTNAQFRHLMLDLHALLPHHKKESKMDIKKELRAINEICDIKGCGE